jgi:hypothetical protein
MDHTDERCVDDEALQPDGLCSDKLLQFASVTCT